jgi:hypothetical protein
VLGYFLHAEGVMEVALDLLIPPCLPFCRAHKEGALIPVAAVMAA